MKRLLALHGLLDSPEAFEALQENLPDWEIIAPRVPQNRTTLQGRQKWLCEWVEREDLKNFHLLGHSLGGALAARTAEDLRPRSLLLLAPVGFSSVPLARALRSPALRGPLRWSAPLGVRTSWLARATYRHLFSAGGEIPEKLLGELQRDPRGALRRAEREMNIVVQAGRDVPPSAYRGPVCALWGERDRLVPWREGQDVLRVFPQARIEQLRGVGHDLLREDPSALARWIEESV